MAPAEEQYDLIIIGGGPAGLAAGIYGGRARLKTLLLERGAVGGRAFSTREIVNYPGIEHTSGPELMEQMCRHCESFGVTIRIEQVKSAELEPPMKTVKTRRHVYHASAVILATGTKPRILGVPGETELTGQGVSYCATCDAEFFQDQDVVVVGSGDQAVEESMYIAKFAKHVDILALHDEGNLSCNQSSAEKAMRNPRITFLWNSTLAAIHGEDSVTGVTVKNVRSGEKTEIKCEGVFLFVGMIPDTGFLQGQVELDSRGFIPTDEKMQTNLPGVFAAGDVRVKALRQISTAVGDGATAATAAESTISEWNEYEQDVLKSEKPVLMCFWSPDRPEGLDLLAELQTKNESAGEPYRIVEVNILRKRRTADHFHITAQDDRPLQVLKLVNGTVTDRDLDPEEIIKEMQKDESIGSGNL